MFLPDPCDELDCDAGYECLIHEPTNEAYCSPNCDDLNPCGATEECQIDPVQCVRAPCPGVLSCVGVGEYTSRSLLNVYHLLLGSGGGQKHVCSVTQSLQILVKTSHVMMVMSVWCMSPLMRPIAVPTVTSTLVKQQNDARSII